MYFQYNEVGWVYSVEAVRPLVSCRGRPRVSCSTATPTKKSFIRTNQEAEVRVLNSAARIDHGSITDRFSLVFRREFY